MQLFQRESSLRNRLLVTASLVLFVFLGLMGLVLDQAFRQSAEKNIEERLKIQIYGLLSVAEVDKQSILLPELLQEPRFNNLASGLYAVVLDGAGQEQWRTPSAIDLNLDATSTEVLSGDLLAGEFRFESIELQRGPNFYMSYKILWLGAGEIATPFTFTVLQSTEPYLSEISSYRNSLWGWLAAVVVALIAVQGLVMKWGLAPLGELAVDLKAIEDGKQQRLDGIYPEEMTGVTRNLNLLLSSERQQREKYRTTLADLAHSLKTPLAILKGSANQIGYDDDKDLSSFQSTIDEQISRMDDIISYQLERAVIDSTALIKKSIIVKPVVEKLILALEKVYLDKNMHVDFNFSACTFFGDERDLMEVLGNVMDNAFKYGKSRLRIDIGPGIDTDIKVEIEDDGAGIADKDRTRILRRGARLDSRTAGQGIGLAVVGEIVSRYRGELIIGASVLGGAKVTITLA